jgi:hypothetical protein
MDKSYNDISRYERHTYTNIVNAARISGHFEEAIIDITSLNKIYGISPLDSDVIYYINLLKQMIAYRK